MATIAARKNDLICLLHNMVDNDSNPGDIHDVLEALANNLDEEIDFYFGVEAELLVAAKAAINV